MALDDILSAIRRDSKAEAAELRREGERRAAAIERDADARAEALAACIAARAERRAEHILRDVERDVDRNRRDARLQAERARLDALFADLEARLASARDDPESHRVVTERLVEEALAQVPEASVIRLDPRDLDIVGPLAASGGLSLQPTLRTWGGVVVCADDRRRVDNTLEARLRARRDDLLLLIGTAEEPRSRPRERCDG